jgi:putative aldouronate transport system permease protein
MMEVVNQSMKPTTTDATTLAYASAAARTTTQSLQMAAMIVALGPIMLAYPFLQKYFASGMMLGAVKG